MKRERRDSAMKSTKIALLATVLVGGLGLMFALAVAPVEAKPNKCLENSDAPGCGGGGGGKSDDTTACKIDFNAKFRDAVFFTDGTGITDAVMSDGRGDYNDGEQRMMIRTGSGPGFRFDTNGGSQKLEGAGGVRELALAVPYFDYEGSENILISSGVDLRFDLSAGGLDLCSLDGTVVTGDVGLNILFEDNGGTKWIVKYSAGCTDENDTSSSPVVVTRTGNVGADTWTIVGATACLFEYDGPMVGDVQTMPFEMTITAQ